MATEPSVFEFPESVKQEDCANLAAFLSKAEGCPVELDASAVRRMHGLAAQALVMAYKTWSAAGTPINIVAPSPAFRDAFDTLGLAAHLPCGGAQT